MISIIICTLKQSLPTELICNIDSSIGTDYEIIHIYNDCNKYSIFEAYNLGILKARFPICCFMHDDIVFHSKNWGKIVNDKFRNYSKLGAVSVAGCKYIRKMPAISNIPLYNSNNYIQSEKINNRRVLVSTNSKDEKIIVFDGLWFCIRTCIFEQIKFDEINFRGFHFYDLDISLQVYNAGYESNFISGILIEHISQGTLSDEWLRSSLIFYKKWKSYLPINILVQGKNSRYLEDEAIISFLRNIKNLKTYDLLKPWFKISMEVKGSIFKLLIVLNSFIIKLLKAKIEGIIR